MNPISSSPDLGVCRVIIDEGPCSGAWNMAVDEILLDSALAGCCSVRWYRWEQATVSLGYFQPAVDAVSDSRLRNLPIVRRLSGGGAIVHHHELTYSCAVPALHPLAAEPRRLYTAVHECIIDSLAGFGYAAKLRGTSTPARGNEFLCFSRMDDFDVVMAGHKVLGSAQRRRKGAVLQHGSLVLERSEWAPEFPGVFECGGHSIPVPNLLERLGEALPGIFGSLREHCRISGVEMQAANALADRHTASLRQEIGDLDNRREESV